MSVLGKADNAVAARQGVNYPWAMNPIKCDLAARQVYDASKIDSSVINDEETIKARYIELGGVLVGDPRIQASRDGIPEASAKGGVKITTKQSKGQKK